MHLTSGLRYLGCLLPCLALASACDRQGFSLSDDVPISNGPTSATGGAGVGGSGLSTGGVPVDPCQRTGSEPAPTLAAQTVSHLLPAQQKLYALVTDAEAQALREGAPLVPEPTAGAPLSTLGAMLQQLAASTSEQRRRLAEVLVPRFASPRSTWPNPWALRLIGHPGSEHMNALRIVLRDEALTVSLMRGSPRVFDVNNAEVSLEVALAEPERLAVIYYQVDASQPISGISDRCENGMRELALGNEAMVQEWSLGTRQILARLNNDIDQLQVLFELVRKCPSSYAISGGTFRATTVCQTWQTFNTSTEYLAYQWSLATPVEPYKATPQNLASLIQALQDDRFDPDDPFIVEPAPPAGSAGSGSGGAGGEDAGGDAGADSGGQRG